MTSEVDEAFEVRLMNPSNNAALGPLRTATGSIINKTDFTAPTFVSATVNGASLRINFSEDLGGSPPASSAFTVKVNGATVAIASTVWISDTVVFLTLDSAVTETDTVTVSYTKPSANNLRDVSGNEVADFSDETVTSSDDAAGGFRQL